MIFYSELEYQNYNSYDLEWPGAPQTLKSVATESPDFFHRPRSVYRLESLE